MRNSIKHILLGLCLLLFTSSIYAQKNEKRRYDFKPGSEVAISYGANYLP